MQENKEKINNLNTESEESKKNNDKKENKSTEKNRKLKPRVILVLAFILILAIIAYISYRGTYLETIEIGENFTQIFLSNLKYKYATIGINFLILFVAISFTNRSIRKGLKVFFDEENKVMPKLPSKSIAFILSAIFSIAISGGMSKTISLFMNKAWFGTVDPIFNMDITFYIFEKPFIEMIVIYFIALVIGLAIYATIYYIIVFNAYFDGINSQTLKKSNFFKQLLNSVILISFGIAAYILITTQGIISDKFLILSDDASTGIYGAGITEVTIKLWGYRIFAIMIVACAIRAVNAFKNGKNKKIVSSILAIPVYLVVLFVVMVGFKIIYINSNELDREKNYLAHNIENTKTAYGIKIEELDVDVGDATSLDNVEKNLELVNQVTTVNEEITLKTIGVTQTSTGYYLYRNSNIAKYDIDGKEEIVYVSPREIVSSGNRTYNNKTYEYTHGFGAIITYANSTDELGNIQYVQKDFTGEDQKIKITEPRIYFGLETNNTIVTNTKNKTEFDYPTTTSQNAVYSYTGNAGLELNLIDRIILAIKEKDINLAFSSNVSKDSKILINRNIIDRAKTIMPDLIYDEEPYLVVNDEGKLVWVLDAYTVTNKYPYSQYTTIEHDNIKEQINYIRNSVKVLIDAYNGTMKFYITDEFDPLIIAYRNMYSDLFETEPIPSDISKHFTYPKYLYEIQAKVLERYHNVSTDVLYRSDDVWEIAKQTSTTSSTKGTKQDPYYTILKTINSNKYELGLVIPYTQLDKENLRAYLVGTYDNGNAKLQLYKFSQDSNILGPMQLETLLSQDETISKELESLNVAGTKNMKNTVIVPINNSMLYVQTIYQVSLNEAKSTPVLKKVIVASGNKLAIGNTLQEAINNLLSKSAVNIEVENTDTIEDLVQSIIRANTNLKNSSKNNDWEMIGKDLKKLQELIDKLEVLQKEKEEKELQNMINNNTINTVNSNSVINE